MAELKDDIEKYLRGQLSPTEMHALEKKALSDPFLAEALEGASSIRAEQFFSDVIELKHRITDHRQARNPKKMILRIAAAISLLAVASFVIYTFIRPEDPAKLAQKNESPAPETKPEAIKPDTPSAVLKEKPKQDLLSLAPITSSAQPAQAKEPVREETPSGVAALQAESAGAKSESESQPQDLTDVVEPKAGEAGLALKKEKATEERLDPSPVDDVAKDKDAKVARSASKTFDQSGNQISGTVTDSEDGAPLPGVTIVQSGTTNGAVSDVQGNYQLDLDPASGKLAFAFVGYQTQEVTLTPGQSKLDVTLATDVAALSEVVVSGYGPGKNNASDEAIQPAGPTEGKKKYDQYLAGNLHYPTLAVEKKVEGRVVVEFMVQADGTLSGFTVVRGIGNGCDEEAVRLVINGPTWSPSHRGNTPVASTARVAIRFKLPK